MSGLHAAHTLSLAYRCSGRQRRKWTCSVWVPGPSAPVSSHQSSRCPSGPREEGGTRGTGAWAGSRAQGLLGWPQSLRGPEPEAASLGAYSVPRALKSHPQEPRGRQENASGMAVDWFVGFPHEGPPQPPGRMSTEAVGSPGRLPWGTLSGRCPRQAVWQQSYPRERRLSLGSPMGVVR